MNKLKKEKEIKIKQICYACGKTGHIKHNCPFLCVFCQFSIFKHRFTWNKIILFGRKLYVKMILMLSFFLNERFFFIFENISFGDQGISLENNHNFTVQKWFSCWKNLFWAAEMFCKNNRCRQIFFVVFPVSRLHIRFQKLFLGSFLANRGEKS